VPAVRTVTTIKLDPSQIRATTTGTRGPVFQAVTKAAAETRDRAKVDLLSNSLIDTGRLVNSIERIVEVRGTTVVGRVGTDVEYGPLVHEGTRSPIIPRRKQALAFVPRRGARVIVVSQVRGTKETGRFSPFLTNALAQLNLRDFT
jgi:hypothetical protein